MDSEHKGRPQRPPASAHLMVASTDRYRNFVDRTIFPVSSANWNTNKLSNLLYGYFTRLAISQLNFEWRIPTIVPDGNDEFFIVIDGTGISVTIPYGFYTGAELATEIEDLVTSDPEYDGAWGFTATYNSNGSFTFDLTTGFEMGFLPLPSTPVINKLYQTLGINTDNVSLANTQITGPAPMVYTRWVDIVSSRLTQFQRVKDGSTLPYNITDNIIARVYASPPNIQINPTSTTTPNFSSPWVMTIDYNTPKHIKWEVNQAINNFDIQVFDEFGEPMYWSPKYATEYNFTFLASET